MKKWIVIYCYRSLSLALYLLDTTMLCCALCAAAAA